MSWTLEPVLGRHLQFALLIHQKICKMTRMRAWQILLVGILALIAIAFLPSYQSVLIASVALVIFGLVLFGFLLRPHPEVLHLRTTTMTYDWQLRPCVEHDQIAIKVEICRLWMLFVPTFVAVACLLSLAVSGTAFLNYGWEGIVAVAMSPPYWILSLVLVTLISAWIRERWTLRNAKACSATQIVRRGARVSYCFVDSSGEFFGDSGINFTCPKPPQLATIVLYRADQPEFNRIASGCLFHRLVIVAHGITDLDEHTVKDRLRWPRSKVVQDTAAPIPPRHPCPRAAGPASG